MKFLNKNKHFMSTSLGLTFLTNTFRSYLQIDSPLDLLFSVWSHFDEFHSESKRRKKKTCCMYLQRKQHRKWRNHTAFIWNQAYLNINKASVSIDLDLNGQDIITINTFFSVFIKANNKNNLSNGNKMIKAWI